MVAEKERCPRSQRSVGRPAGTSSVPEESRGILFIVSSPSGGGKTTLIRETIKRLAEFDIVGHFSISHTTRPARPAETDGVDYHFVDEEIFERMVQAGDFLEWAEYADSLYGTSRQAVEEDLQNGSLVAVPIRGIEFHRSFYLIYRKNRQLSPLCEAFLAHLKGGGRG